MKDFQTADLLDQHEEAARAGQVRVVEPMFSHYGGRRRFCGTISTLKVFEDNSLVRKALETAGNGRVLVIDGGGSKRCALVGDQLAQLGVKNGWAGIVVFGCIRDSAAMAGMDIGLRALDTHPLKSIKKGAGDADIPVSFGGVSIAPGEQLYADEDGIVVAPAPLL
ncbi:MAG: ribonuclease E activity regulator RraA [Candidatus Methylophosphatis roskildensis]